MEMNIQQDHVHLMLGAKPSYSPSQIMQLIEGRSSQKIRKQFPNLAEHPWTDSFRADRFFLGTVGNHHLKSVIKYVRDQKHGQEIGERAVVCLGQAISDGLVSVRDCRSEGARLHRMR